MNAMNKNFNQGFTLLEIMVAVAVVAVLASIAVPSYQSYQIKTKRSQMMVSLQDVASEINRQKVIQGNYIDINTEKIVPPSPDNKYPKDEEVKLYEVTAVGIADGKWTLTASPIMATIMDGDGVLTLNYQNYKCRIIGTEKKCGTGREWKD